MKQSDRERPENRDHYNLSITQEALAFLEIYPERKAEFVRRVKEGGISIGAFQNNNCGASKAWKAKSEAYMQPGAWRKTREFR